MTVLVGPVVYVTVAAPAALAAPNATYDWLQFNGDPQHSGNNHQETTISWVNVGRFHPIFQVALPDVADGAPVLLTAVTTPSGVRDLLYLTTRAGHLVALDAHDGSQVWVQQHPAGNCHVNNGSQPCYTTSSPAIDPNRQYVYTYGLDGYVHRHRVGDGAEITGTGWPELATTKPYDEKGSSALAIATVQGGASYLYVTNSGYFGDQGDYQGHITAINLADGSQHVFNSNCSDQTVHFVTAPGTPNCAALRSAIWARPGVVYSAATNRIYAATGNGPFTPAQHHWGDSVFALQPDGTGSGGNPLDTYTPANFEQLDAGDADLGSAAPAILPVPSTSTVQHLAVQGGKDGVLRLINLDNLSSQGGPGHTGGEIGPTVVLPQGGQILTQPAVWTNPADGNVWVFVSNSSGISGWQLVVGADGTPALQNRWTAANTSQSSPLVANGVVYQASSGSIRALDPLTGRLFWQDTAIGAIHWESPVVAGGLLYITDEAGHLTAYGP